MNFYEKYLKNKKIDNKENKKKWYRETWIIFSLCFTPLFFIGFYLLLTDKVINIGAKIMFFTMLFVAIGVTYLQMNGSNFGESLPFYTPLIKNN